LEDTHWVSLPSREQLKKLLNDIADLLNKEKRPIYRHTSQNPGQERLMELVETYNGNLREISQALNAEGINVTQDTIFRWINDDLAIQTGLKSFAQYARASNARNSPNILAMNGCAN